MNLPNKLTLLRIILTPVFMAVLYMGFPGASWVALAIFIIASFTDLLDGKIARKYNLVTDFGKFADPLADKITQLTLILCLSSRYTFLRPVLYLLVLKELFQLVAGILSLRQGKMLSGALPEGKVSTAVLFTSLILLVMFPTVSSATVRAIAAVDIFLLVIALRGYILAYLGYYPRLQSNTE